MPADRAHRRTRKSEEFDFVIIPVGQGKSSKSYRLTKTKLGLYGSGAVLLIVLITLAALVLTPLALFVPIPNSILEEKYGRQLLETQKELQALAQEVFRLGEYNRKLKKVLGNEIPDTLTAVAESSPVADTGDGGFPVELTLPPYSREEAFGQDNQLPVTGVAMRETGHPAMFPLINPVNGIVSQRFDPEKLHYGIDYASRIGTPVFAAADGYVVFSGWTPDDGNMMMISHGGEFLTVYKHNQSLMRPSHATVRRGDVIALLGSSGRTSEGPHLHFEVWKDGVPVDPEQYLLLFPEGTKRQ